MKFYAATCYRISLLGGGVIVEMMPGAFEKVESLHDAVKTHKAMTGGKQVYMAVLITLDDAGKMVSVEPVGYVPTGEI